MKLLIRSISKYLFGMQYHVIALYRISHYFRLRVPFIGGFFAAMFRHFLRVYSGCDISPLAIIDPNVSFPHPIGIVIGEGVKIEAGTKIWQHVTIGSHGKAGISTKYPVIGRDVRIYSKASIIGSVQVGASSTIGAHSLVTKDVPTGRTAVGIPARIL